MALIYESEQIEFGTLYMGTKLRRMEAGLSIIHEKMQGDTKEKYHYHSKARQFFFILKGKVILNIDEQNYYLSEHDGIEIQPNQKHRISNESENDAEFLVISKPAVKDDRTNLE